MSGRGRGYGYPGDFHSHQSADDGQVLQSAAVVDVWVACATDEFKEADYKSFNLSMGQYMDSMELAMYC